MLLEAAAATEAEIELTYHVAGASWRPLYDLVLDGEKLKVSYLAEITQQTGEDWPEVTLVLSTTRQGLRQTLPELTPVVHRPCPSRRPGRARRCQGGRRRGVRHARRGLRRRARSAGGGAGPGGGGRGGAARPAAKVLAAEPGRSESGAGLIYTVARPLAVPSDGGPHKTLVAQLGSGREPRLPHGPRARARGLPARHRHQRPAPAAARPGQDLPRRAVRRARRTWTPSPRARSSRSSSASTTRSRSSASCAAAPRARPSSAAPGRSTSPTRSRWRTTATARPPSASTTTSRSPPTATSR